MKTYARIQDGIVMEIIPPATYGSDSPEGVEPPFKQGDEIPIDVRYNSALIDGAISWMADITAVIPQPQGWWTATQEGGNWTFMPPASPEVEQSS